MHAITGVATSITAFVGRTLRGPVNQPVRLQSFAEFTRLFGGLCSGSTLSYAVSHFFQHGGTDALIVRVFNGNVPGGTATGTADDVGGAITDVEILGDREARTGIYALESADLFNLLCIPPLKADVDQPDADPRETTWAAAAAYCQDRRAMLIIDPPSAWTANDGTAIAAAESGVNTLRATLGNDACRNAAVYFPRLRMPDPLGENHPRDFAPCGALAGIIARTDAQRGVWKAPAGREATFSGIEGFTVTVTEAQNRVLNPSGLNCLRTFRGVGNVVWGARTVAGADLSASEWKYVPVRRLALYLEESLFRGTKWAVFEPNDAPLWAQIRLNAGVFMQNLFRQGAFMGKSPKEAFFVKCDHETTTPADIHLGIVNILVGFAPLKPAEFVILRIQQIAGQA